jgi:HK97 family phage portal protein
MGILTRPLKSAGIGWPNTGWPPPPGYTGRSITDITVNHDTAMTVSAFHAGVRLIAEDLASLPWIVYRRTDQGRERADSHPVASLLDDSPNPEMTAMVFRETCIGHYLTWGNFYAEREYNRVGQVVRLWLLRPDRMTVERDEMTSTRRFRYRLPDGKEVILPERNVWHVPGFGFDGLVGYSRVAMARRSLENAIAVEEYGLHTFATGAMQAVVIKHPHQLGTEAKRNIREGWEEQQGGLTNAQRAAVLDEGMTVDTVGFPPEDAQFLESRRWSVEDVARWLRLAPTKLSDFSRATFSNIEETNRAHATDTLRPVGRRLDQAANKDLIGIGTGYYAEHLYDAILVASIKDRFEAYGHARANAFMTEDEVRDRENLNRLTPEQRRGLLYPLNTIPGSAYDENGMTMTARVAAVSTLVRSGFDPEAALTAMNVPSVPHTGAIPVTVYQLEERPDA